eukprot:scaffold3383_cov129-Skeletonema_dohrnii-CCMP3373.AAC.6
MTALHEEESGDRDGSGWKRRARGAGVTIHTFINSNLTSLEPLEIGIPFPHISRCTRCRPNQVEYYLHCVETTKEAVWTVL